MRIFVGSHFKIDVFFQTVYLISSELIQVGEVYSYSVLPITGLLGVNRTPLELNFMSGTKQVVPYCTG